MSTSPNGEDRERLDDVSYLTFQYFIPVNGQVKDNINLKIACWTFFSGLS